MTSRYDALAQHLRAQTDDLVTLDFAEIEKIIGSPLPPSARKHSAWWSNSKTHAAWILVGWLSEGRDMRAERVSFRRGTRVERIPCDAPTPRIASTAFDGASLLASDFAPVCDASIKFGWRHLGPIQRGVDGKLLFPAAPKTPGLYRMRVSGQIYIGEAVDLKRRFGNYRNPGPTQQTSIRINVLLREALEAGAAILLDVAYENVTLRIATAETAADLSNKAIRRLAEQAAIAAHGGIDVELLNR